MYKYYQIEGGEETWKEIQASHRSSLPDPMFVTVLAVDRLVTDGMTKAEISKIKYSGPLYFDWDGTSVAEVVPNVQAFIESLRSLGINDEHYKLYATGGRGFHIEIPPEVFMEKPKAVEHLPLIFKEMALDLVTDTMDLRVYSGRKGRMWRQPNVQRPNGMFKVRINHDTLDGMDEARYRMVCSDTAIDIDVSADFNPGLALRFDKAAQKIKQVLGKRKGEKPVVLPAKMPSMDALMEGRGIKPGTGFQTIALQLGVFANARGYTEDDLVARCAGLLESHESDGSRYNSQAKRERELRRMWVYTNDNPCYSYSAGAIKVLLTHPAPDVEGMSATPEEVQAMIDTPVEHLEPDVDDLAGVVLNQHGVFARTEFGPKRVSAISFDNVRTLRSTDNGTIAMVEADVMVNGKTICRSPIELDTFHSAGNFNKFAARHGHAFQGNDANVRGMYLRLMEKAKLTGGDNFAVTREGLDVINIPNHQDERLRKPFLIWADGKGVVLEPQAAQTGLKISFQGFPDPRGQFRSDLHDAPNLATWLEEGDHKERMRVALENFLQCQAPNSMANLLGWYIACFYRMLFHKAYNKFPLLHVNGAAGSAKTETNKALLGLFYYNQEPRMLTPSSTVFAINYCASGSASIPLVVDEYKPHEMPAAMHDKLKLIFRDAYNCRDVARGGGSRDNDDYRVLSSAMLAAPMAFIAEAVEDEAALMERVVLVTMSRPTPLQASKNLARYLRFSEFKECLAVIGKYIAADIVSSYTIEQLKKDFDPLLEAARKQFMLQEGDMSSLAPEQLQRKFSAKERTVFNFTVARFGLRRFKSLMEDIYGDRLNHLIEDLDSKLYDRMLDLGSSTQAEWLKVLNVMVDMSYLDDNLPYRMVVGKDYALVHHGGIDCVEISPRLAYAKYRQYCRMAGSRPLFSGETAYLHSLRDASAVVNMGHTGGKIQCAGGSILFDAQGLSALGVRAFRR